jgi:hypothetical protein
MSAALEQMVSADRGAVAGLTLGLPAARTSAAIEARMGRELALEQMKAAGRALPSQACG